MRILKMIIECAAPLHCGGGTDDVLDQPVNRDAYGFWRIPGSSLAGALRSLAAAMDEDMANRLFGEQKKEESHASLVWCEDGLLLDFDGRVALHKLLRSQNVAEIRIGSYCAMNFVRDHVCLDLDSGTGAEGGKFDAEIVPPGARFLLEFRLDGWNREPEKSESDFFDSLCALVLAGKLNLGGKSGLGYGEYRVVKAEYAELNLSESSGMEAWLKLESGADFPAEARKLPLPVPEKGEPGQNLDGWLEIPLLCDGPILIGGGNISQSGGEHGADMLFALTPRLVYDSANGQKGALTWEPIIPASSMRGVTRHALYRVLQARGCASTRAEEILREFFGYANENGAKRGKLVFTDCPLGKDRQKRHFQFVQHVALDRFSAGTLAGALFSEEPFWQKGAEVLCRIRANNLRAAEAALLFHALLDLCAGETPVGGGVNRGNGRLVLAGWNTDPQKAMASLAGDISWRGEPLCADGACLGQLRKFSAEWDSALRELA